MKFTGQNAFYRLWWRKFRIWFRERRDPRIQENLRKFDAWERKNGKIRGPLDAARAMGVSEATISKAKEKHHIPEVQ